MVKQEDWSSTKRVGNNLRERSDSGCYCSVNRHTLFTIDRHKVRSNGRYDEIIRGKAQSLQFTYHAIPGYTVITIERVATRHWHSSRSSWSSWQKRDIDRQAQTHIDRHWATTSADSMLSSRSWSDKTWAIRGYECYGGETQRKKWWHWRHSQWKSEQPMQNYSSTEERDTCYTVPRTAFKIDRHSYHWIDRHYSQRKDRHTCRSIDRHRVLGRPRSADSWPTWHSTTLRTVRAFNNWFLSTSVRNGSFSQKATSHQSRFSKYASMMD